MEHQRIKVLVTGASGFVGSHVLYHFNPAQAVGCFHSNTPQPDGYDYVHIDLQSSDSLTEVFHTIQPTHVIHCAAKSNLDWCEKNPHANHRINAEAPVFMASLCKERNVRYLFVSSDMVFDGVKGSYCEDDMPNPLSLYGRAKLAAETGVLEVNPEAVIARIALVYGLPVQKGRGSSFLTWIISRLQQKLEVPLFIDQYRSPVSVNELTFVLRALLFSDYYGIVHVGGAEKLDRMKFGSYVCRVFHFDEALLKPIHLSDMEQHAQRPRDLSLSSDRLRTIISYTPADCLAHLKFWAKSSASSNDFL
ncbi:MAG: SDR family oxidoreductase [Deferribacteres bacterium]|nr:SDR family oxidoreductase [candidate division KSB1 bacterium]MCB9501532.1 SDR family oxidoreductase [Deferribacteres bacterium]